MTVQVQDAIGAASSYVFVITIYEEEEEESSEEADGTDEATTGDANGGTTVVTSFNAEVFGNQFEGVTWVDESDTQPTVEEIIPLEAKIASVNAQQELTVSFN